MLPNVMPPNFFFEPATAYAARDGFAAAAGGLDNPVTVSQARSRSSKAGRRTEIKAAVPEPSIFHEPWWMNIASGGRYSEATVTSGGKLAGRLPYVFTRRAGIGLITMPLMAHVLGPAIMPEFAAPGAVRSLKQISVTQELLAQLPKNAPVYFRLHGGFDNTLAFQISGFEVSPQFTVEIAPDTEDALWRQMRDKTRNIIRRAEERLTVEAEPDVKAFVSFYEENLKLRGAVNAYDRDISVAIMSECFARDAGMILKAISPTGETEAAIFIVWDAYRCHYFMSSRTLAAHSGAISLLIWMALRQAARRGLLFDMDSIHIQGDSAPNLLLLTGFGGNIVPRYCVSRTPGWLRVGKVLRGLIP